MSVWHAPAYWHHNDMYVVYVCVCVAVESKSSPLQLWEETHNAIKASGGKFPETHTQTASVHAYNLGVKAFYYGRKVEAEEWMGMAYKLSKLTTVMDKTTENRIIQVPFFVLFSLASSFSLVACNVICMYVLFVCTCPQNDYLYALLCDITHEFARGLLQAYEVVVQR